MDLQQQVESFTGRWVPSTPPPDRFPTSPDDLPEGKYLGECKRCGEEHYAAYVSDADSIETAPCGSCGSELCTECPQAFCDVGDHAVCRDCIRVLRGADDPLNVCLKCAEPVLEAPLGEIYQMKRAMGFALDNICQGKPYLAMSYLRGSLDGAKQRGF